jgi:two-component sensor histidine kinase
VERSDDERASPALIVGTRRGGALLRALARAGLPAELVSGEEAWARAEQDTPAVVIEAPAAEAAALCARLRAEERTARVPLVVLAGQPAADGAPAVEPDAWLPAGTRAAAAARRVQEVARLRRAEREIARLQDAVAALSAENEQLYDRARRDADATTRLLRELQHRVRNNLASIQALLVLERHRAPPRSLAEALDVAIARLRSMAALHDSQSGAGDAVDLASLARAVARSALDVFGAGHPIALEVNGEATVPSRMGSALALVLNELVTNAVQHARASHLRIDLARGDAEVRLRVTDDGQGLARAPSAGSGLRIVRAVVETGLQGELALDSAMPGTRVAITVPVPAAT